MKDFATWNKVTITKLAWAITEKDSLWAKWIHGRYIKEVPWWECTPCQTATAIGKKYIE